MLDVNGVWDCLDDSGLVDAWNGILYVALGGVYKNAEGFMPDSGLDCEVFGVGGNHLEVAVGEDNVVLADDCDDGLIMAPLDGSDSGGGSSCLAADGVEC